MLFLNAYITILSSIKHQASSIKHQASFDVFMRLRFLNGGVGTGYY